MAGRRHFGEMRGADAPHQRILDAAIAELATTTVDSFTMAAVAARAGLEVQAVKNIWANTPELLIAALMSYADVNLPIPDTGSLRGDLIHYATSFAAAVNSPIGRRLLDAIVASPKDWDVSDWRPGFFASREKRVAPLLKRAVARGECSPDVDAMRIMGVLTAGLCSPIQFHDRPVTDEDCEAVVDLVLNGILRNR